MSGPSHGTATTPPPAVRHVRVAFPAAHPHVVLVTLDRPAQLNSVPRWQHAALARLWDWYDAEPSLRCAVLTGAGGRAFCAGADLKEWDVHMAAGAGAGASRSEGGSEAVKAEITQDGTGARGPAVRSTPATGNNDSNADTAAAEEGRGPMPVAGFGGISNRGGKKPVIAAVDGICFGGGMEMALNCDMVVASPKSTFGLPEVGVGVVRLARSVGRHRAMEMALSGRRYSAHEMRAWGLVNEIVEEVGGRGKEGSGGSDGSEKGGSDGEYYGPVVEAALGWADRIAANSPDAVIVSREGVKLGFEGISPEVATDILTKGWWARIEGAENMVEGVRSFVERRKPIWKDSKL